MLSALICIGANNVAFGMLCRQAKLVVSFLLKHLSSLNEWCFCYPCFCIWPPLISWTLHAPHSHWRLPGLQTGKDAADAERAKTEDRLHLLKDKYKQAQSKLQSLRELVQQVRAFMWCCQVDVAMLLASVPAEYNPRLPALARLASNLH